MSCTAFPFVFITCMVGVPVPSPFFLTSWIRPRIFLFLTLALRSPWFLTLTTSLVANGMTFCSSPSEPFLSTCLGRSSFFLVCNTISFWLRSIISLAHASTLEEDCLSLRVRPHEVTEVATTLLFMRNCAAHQSTFSSFYLRDVSPRHLDTFSIWPVVVAQQVVSPTNPFGSGVVTLGFGLARCLYLRLLDPYILHVGMCVPLLQLLSLFPSDFGLRELQKPYTQEPLVGT